MYMVARRAQLFHQHLDMRKQEAGGTQDNDQADYVDNGL